MLGKSDATPMIAVTDLDRARRFYEETLGLKARDEWGEGVTLESGDTAINLYKSAFAGTNKATALNFDVETSTAKSASSRTRASCSSITTCPGSNSVAIAMSPRA